MKRLQRVTILLSLIEKLHDKGSWCGETHIQKATYFLQELMEVPLGFEFILYKHGPFSFDLSDEIVAMRADSILTVQPRPYPYGPTVLPGEGSASVKHLFPVTLRAYADQVEFVARQLGNMSVADLERLATALYVTLEGQAGKDVESRARRVNDLKPHISIEEARKAVEMVDKIREEVSCCLQQRKENF